MQTDLPSANIDDKLKPTIAYVPKLTVTPSRLTEADAQTVYDAGWNERALYDAIVVCALFNLMIRIVEGTGYAPNPDKHKSDSDSKLDSYVSWGQEAGFIDP